MIAATEETSGSVNRWLRPDSVRHMSVTTAMQGLTAAHHDTQRDNSEAAREPGYAQATGRFRRWWQVLGSNQRRLSRRFYRYPPKCLWPAKMYSPRDFPAYSPPADRKLRRDSCTVADQREDSPLVHGHYQDLPATATT